MIKQLLPLILIVLTTGAQLAPVEQAKRLSLQKGQIVPLQKGQTVLMSPKSYLKRVLRVDPKTGEEILYDPKPRIELLDPKAGRYSLKWIGYDSKEKVVVYQRPDAIDVIVVASVTKIDSGQYVYQYTLQNLATSGEHLASFELQTFCSDMIPSKLPTTIDNVFVGKMSNNIPEFRVGKWILFAPLPPRAAVNPGQSIMFRLTSSSAPGLVMCRVDGGDFVMKGAGEEMPQELENALPDRFAAMPSGYTVGPIDNLKTLSPAERASYLLKLLPKFKELGWITADALRWYQQTLSRSDLEIVFERTQQYLKEGNITNEVFAMIQAIKE